MKGKVWKKAYFSKAVVFNIVYIFIVISNGDSETFSF